MLTQFQTSYLASSDLYYQLFHFSIKLVMSVACVWSWCWLIFLSPHRWAPGCNSFRKLNQHPQSTAFGQSASWHAFPAPTTGPCQRVQRDLREPASPLSAGFTVSLKSLLFLKQNSLTGFKKKVKSLRLSYILLPLPWPKCQPFPLRLAFLYLFLLSFNVKMPLCSCKTAATGASMLTSIAAVAEHLQFHHCSSGLQFCDN